jgi:hypothetical protein
MVEANDIPNRLQSIRFDLIGEIYNELVYIAKLARFSEKNSRFGVVFYQLIDFRRTQELASILVTLG